METLDILAWIGIGLCVVQSGIFSGLNLAMFGVSAMNLQVKADTGNEHAARLMAMRKDSNFLLTTILWGNVGTNVLLTLLSDSVLAGAFGFAFSTFVITFGGEILPQAYFSRHALRMATLLRPVLRFWQFMLFPIAKPSAMILDAWLGPEGLEYQAEEEVRQAIIRHIAAPHSEMSRVEGIGALNFLSLDDVPVTEEGEPLSADCVITLPEQDGKPIFPAFERAPDDPFLQSVQASGKAWVILTSPDGEPRLALDADGFLRHALFEGGRLDARHYCHRPIVVRDLATTLEDVLPQLNVERERAHDDVVDNDLVLVWGDERRIITGADLLGRLLRGIARVK